jgi:hypothetical protein
VFVKGPSCARGTSYAESTEGEQCKRFYVRSRFNQALAFPEGPKVTAGNERDHFSPPETSGHR